jgi:hypothetical protein
MFIAIVINYYLVLTYTYFYWLFVI